MKLRILIAGGGGTTVLLLRDPVIREIVDQVIVIESDPKRRQELERLGDILVIEGDASDTSVYEEINMREINAVLALTSKDEVNFLVLAIAKQYKIPVRIGVFKDPKVAELVKSLELGTPLVRPSLIGGIIKQILTSLTTPRIVAELPYPLSEYKLYVVTIGENDIAARTSLSEHRLEEDEAYPLLVHDGKELQSISGDVQLLPGYTLFILAKNEKFLGKIKGITT